MERAVGELERLLSMYPDDSPVKFQHIIVPEGRHYRLNFYRIKDRGSESQVICHFEWDSIMEEDEMRL